VSDAIEARLAEIRAVLEACEAEGSDAEHVTVSSYERGLVEVFPLPPGERHGRGDQVTALAVLARLTDQPHARRDLPVTFTTYAAGGFTVYAELRPDAVAEHAVPKSPDCAAGKCGACTGDAWDVATDQMVPCGHDCHTATPGGDV